MYAILNNELYHHGILGQRWGVRRFQNADGSLKPAGEKRYGIGDSKDDTPEPSSKNTPTKDTTTKKSNSKASKKEKLNGALNHEIDTTDKSDKKGFKGLSPTAKKVLIGLGATAAIAITYKIASDKLKAPKLNSMADEIEFNKKNNPFSAIKKIPISADKAHDMQVINPDYGKPGTKMNCTLSSAAYEMRRRGYDVKANRSKFGRNRADISLFYKGVTPADWVDIGSKNNKTTEESFFSAFKDMPEGSRGTIVSHIGPFNFKHAMVWEKENAKTIIRDCQTNKVYDENNLFYKAGSKGIIRLDHPISFLRTDDLEIHPDRIMDAVRPVDKKFPKIYDKIFKGDN